MEQREHIELDELREQVALLKEKLLRQQIISEQNVIAAAQKSISKLNRTGMIWSAFGVFAVVWCAFIFHQLGFSDGFVIGTTILLLFCAVVTIYAHWGIHSIDVARGNQMDIAQRLVRFRKIYSHWHLFSIPAIFVWMYFMYKDTLNVFSDIEIAPMMISVLVGGIIGLVIGLKAHFKVIRETDKVIENINELLQHREE